MMSHHLLIVQMACLFMCILFTEQCMRALDEDSKEKAKIKKRQEVEAEKLKGKGNDAFNKGQYTEAIGHYNMAITKISSNPVLYTNRAQVRIIQGLDF